MNETQDMNAETAPQALLKPGVSDRIHFSMLRSSPTNPRRHFAPIPLQELAENILKLGVQTDLHVRDVAGNEDWEVIAGERRLRAVVMAINLAVAAGDVAKAEELSMVPVKIVGWDDDTVVEFQLIENLQREDLTPIEEAEGYAGLVLRGMTVEQIAAKIGKSPRRVWRALKWARLPKLAKAAFEAGLVGQDLADMIARIPEERAQRLATLELIFFPDDFFEESLPEEELVNLEKDAWQYVLDPEEHYAVENMPRQAARDHVATKYMRTLKEVEFDLADAGLLPVERDSEGNRLLGGACVDCPYRTGSNPAFENEVAVFQARGNQGVGLGRSGIDPNICTQPGCLARKKAAAFAAKAERVRTEYARAELLQPDEVKRVFVSSGELNYGSRFVALDDAPGKELVSVDEDAGEKAQAWGKLLKGVDVPVFIAQDPKGKLRVLVEREVAITAVNERARDKGKESPFAKASDKTATRTLNAGGSLGEPDAKKLRQEQARERRAYVIAMQSIGAKVQAEGLGLESWWLIVEVLLMQLGMDGVKLVAEALEVKVPRPAGEDLNQGHYAAAILEHLREADAGVSWLQGVVMQCLATFNFSWQKLQSEYLKRLAAHFSVSLIEAKNKARDEQKAKPAKGKGKSTEEDSEAPRSNEQINADYTTQTILEEGDRQREEAPSRAMGEEEVEGAGAPLAVVSPSLREAVGGGLDEGGEEQSEDEKNPLAPHEEGLAWVDVGDDAPLSLRSEPALRDKRVPTSDDDAEPDEVESNEESPDASTWPLQRKAAALITGEKRMGDLIGKKPKDAKSAEFKAWDMERKRVKRAAEAMKAA